MVPEHQFSLARLRSYVTTEAPRHGVSPNYPQYPSVLIRVHLWLMGGWSLADEALGGGFHPLEDWRRVTAHGEDTNNR